MRAQVDRGGAEDPGRISFWYSEADPGPVRRPSLDAATEADVCIVGAGYTGLWTAYELLRKDPSLRVVILEAESVGFGASGRNGGWVYGFVRGTRGEDAVRRDRPGMLALERAARDSVDEIGKVVGEERIDCGYRKGGALRIARGAVDLDRVRAEADEDREWGLDPDQSRLLDAGELAELVSIAGARGGIYHSACATVQPAKLALGLARAVERRGATIYEGTRVRELAPGRALTDAGPVEARCVVQATEAYTDSLAGRSRLLLPLASSMIVTEVLGDDVWRAIGWDGREALTDATRLAVYLQRTEDDRIALGGWGVPYRYGSRTDCEGAVPAETVGDLRGRLVELFPVLAEVGYAGAWQGVFGVPRQMSPAVGFDRQTGLGWCGGYIGTGVAASNLAARTLTDLILERDTELTRLPWVGPFDGKWQPEPLRALGVKGVCRMMGVADASEVRTGRPSRLGKIADRIAGL